MSIYLIDRFVRIKNCFSKKWEIIGGQAKTFIRLDVFRVLALRFSRRFKVGVIMEKKDRTVIDGSGLILGRMASIVAKRLLQGEAIDIVNSEAIVVSGRKNRIIEDAKEFLNVKGPRWGPIHYRKPSMMVKKTIRGMLPYKSSHGREAYKRLRVYLGIPPEFINVSKETIDEAKAERLRGGYVTIREIALSIGWKRGGTK